MTEPAPGPAVHSLPPFAGWAGSRKPKLVLVGEAWGESEARLRAPFVGESGKELWKMLGEAWPELAPELHAQAQRLHRYGNDWVKARWEWLEEAQIAMTNVLALRPANNKMEELCASKSEVGGQGYLYPPISIGKYLLPEYLPELDRLAKELTLARPNLIMGLGNTACWALLGATNIGSIRGAITQTTAAGISPSIKFLPTYHPAGVLRQWSWRPIVLADLMKALREAQFPEIRRPRREILVNPSLAEIRAWVDATLASPPPFLAVDTETGAQMIKCIGFARSRSEALVIPFVDLSKPSGCYWDSLPEEELAWMEVQRLLAAPIPKVFQNGMYDFQYILPMRLWLNMHRSHDTMLMHHSLFPELQKGLGFLGSIYTNEASWKLMRTEKQDSEKRDE